jgi:hypothetical protein
MRLAHYALICAMLIPSCKTKTDDTPPMPTAPPPASTPEPVQPTVLSTTEPVAPGEIVRPELDGREDGITGTLVSVSGAKANFKIPTDWKLTKSEFQVATAADQKSELVAGSGMDPTAVLDKMAAAAGLSGCTWQPPQSMTVGKDKLSAQGADGSCKKGAAPMTAGYMSTEGLVVLGAWDPAADRSGVFGSMRSVAKAATGPGGVSNLVACCRALAQNAKSQANPMVAGSMIQAASLCESYARQGNVSGVNGALSQFGMKCQ